MSELTGRALDAAIAVEVMGWRVHFRNTAHWVKAEEEGKVYNRPQAWVGEWRPSTDLNACREAENKVLSWAAPADYERHSAYIQTLLHIVKQRHETTMSNWRLECAMASAEDRCWAMLAAVRDGGAR